MDVLDYMVKKWNIDLNARLPITIPISRHRELVSLFREVGFKFGVEVGTEQGKFAEEICKANPEVKLFCVDPWQSYARYKDIRSQGKLDAYYEEAKTRLAPYNCQLVRKTSMDAVKAFTDELIDFVYIDGNHDFEYVVNDVIYWTKIVRPGGIVAGHDYRKEERNGSIPFHVIQAVNAYTSSYHINPWFILNGKDKCASWMWVKK